MSRQEPQTAVTRKAHSVTEAAEMLGVSRPFFRKHVLPELKVAHVGRRTLIPTTELDAWLDRTAEPLPPTGLETP